MFGGCIIYSVYVCLCVSVDMQKNAGTRLRGIEEVCGSISPTDGINLSLLFAQRIRTTSAMSSAFGDDELIEEG